MSDTPKNRRELLELLKRGMAERFAHPNPNAAAYAYDAFANIMLDKIEAAGCVVVPREATEEMWRAAVDAPFEHVRHIYLAIHRAMTAASPYAPEQEDK
jgi:hypothetical protein